MAMNSKKQVSQIEVLQPGDHIVFNTIFAEHHGIVISVNRDEDVVDVIGARSGGVIESTTFKFSEQRVGPVYLVQYDPEECLPPTEVIGNALGMVGERVGKNNYGSTVEADGDDVDTRRRRQPVTRIEDLQPADHAVFQRRSYEHHGIIISVHPDEDIFNVAEVSKINGKISFATRPHKFSEEKKDAVYVVEYEKGECLPNSEVIRNASRLDGESVEYDLFANNCEHYASAIKTGTGMSEQIDRLVAKVGSITSKFLPFMVVSKVFSLFKRVIFKKKNDQ